MIVDSSAAVAILTNEPERAAFIRLLVDATAKSMSASTLLESSMVVLSRLPTSPAFQELDVLITRAQIVIEPTTQMDALVAREAFRIYGKGRHPAGLNFGDCFTYALARRLNRPILCKGNDFGQTDALVVPLA